MELEDIKDKKRAYMRAYYAKNRERIIARVAEWVEANPEKARANKQRWETKNPEKTKGRYRQWSKQNPDKHEAARQRWLQAHPTYKKDWARSNPDKINAYSHARRAKYVGTYSQADVRKLMKSQHGKCAELTCKVDIRNNYHVDHIHPIALGGSNWPENLQLLCPKCNHKKGAKHPYDWARENGRLFA